MSKNYSNYPFTELAPCFIALVVNLLAMTHFFTRPPMFKQSGRFCARTPKIAIDFLYINKHLRSKFVEYTFPKYSYGSFVTLNRIRTFSHTHAHNASHRSIEMVLFYIIINTFMFCVTFQKFI